MIDFPASPTTGQIFSAAGASWRYDGTKWVSYGVGSGNVGRNLIHNPLYAVAQRGGGSFTTSNTLTLDRWAMYYVGGTMSVFRPVLSDADRTSIGDEAAVYGISATITGTSGAGDNTQFFQRIEDVRRLAGKIVTVSFYANSGTTGFKVGASLDQGFGTGGSPSAGVQGAGQSVTLGTTPQWARYSLTFTLGSAAGKTFGTTDTVGMTQLNLWLSAGSANATRAGSIGVQSGTVNIWGVQLEIGSVATPLEKPDPADDLARCQRFYLAVNALWFICYSAAATNFGQTVSFPTAMRTSPTINIISPGYINASGLAAINQNAIGCSFYAVSGTAGTANFSCNYTASADL